MFQLLKLNDQQTLITNLIHNLNEILKLKTGLVEVSNRNQLLTLANIFTIL